MSGIGTFSSDRAACAHFSPARRLLVMLAGLVALLCANSLPAYAVTPIEIGKEQDRIDLSGFGTPVINVGDRLQIDTAAGTDGVTDRMSVPATSPGSNPHWFVFALRNVADTRQERWLTADRYSQASSGIFSPRLDARQIEAVTPSVGFLPENLALDDTDAYRLTIEPGQTVTFVVELSSGARRGSCCGVPSTTRSARATSSFSTASCSASAGCWRCSSALSSRPITRSFFPPLHSSPGPCSPTSASTSVSGTSCSPCGRRTTRSTAPPPRPASPPRC